MLNGGDKMKKLIVLLILAMTVTLNADVLRWDASTGEVDGYSVYWGTETGVYPFHKDVGNVLEVGIPNQDGALAEHFQLNPGTWYFVVRAYNTIGESGDSNIADLSIAESEQPEDIFPVKLVVPGDVTITITRE